MAWISLIILARSLSSEMVSLNGKQLQEKGISVWGILSYHRIIFVPLLLLLIITFRWEYGVILLNSPMIWGTLLYITIEWTVVAYMAFFILHSAQSLAYLHAFRALVGIPLLVFMGIFINGDIPNVFTWGAILFLGMALVIKPRKNGEKSKNMFRHGIFLLVVMMFLREVLGAIDNALIRNMLLHMESTIFGTALYNLCMIFGVVLLFCFKKVPPQDKIIAKSHGVWKYSLPFFWVISALLEGYCFMNAPIYTIMIISSVVFLISVVSDVRNKRVEMNFRTIFFVVLVLVSTGLSVISLG